MALIVNKDTYITIEQMDTYVSENYLSSDPLRISWNAQTEPDKEVFLRTSFTRMNGLPYTGKPLNVVGSNAFPRINWSLTDWELVRGGQAEIALQFLNNKQVNPIDYEESLKRAALQRQGVKQFRIGDLAEEYNGAGSMESAMNLFGLSRQAFTYLSKWLTGGYRLCTSIKKQNGCN